MEAVEFCEMRHGYCACKKAGSVHCAQILRLVEDQAEIEKARLEREAIDRKRKSRYIEDDPAPRRSLIEEMAMIRDAMLMQPMIMPRRGFEPVTVEKTVTSSEIEAYARRDAMFSVDYSALEKRVLSREDFIRNPVYEELPTPAERRLGSSEKDYVKFHHDPVKRRPS